MHSNKLLGRKINFSLLVRRSSGCQSSGMEAYASNQSKVKMTGGILAIFSFFLNDPHTQKNICHVGKGVGVFRFSNLRKIRIQNGILIEQCRNDVVLWSRVNVIDLLQALKEAPVKQ